MKALDKIKNKFDIPLFRINEAKYNHAITCALYATNFLKLSQALLF